MVETLLIISHWKKIIQAEYPVVVAAAVFDDRAMTIATYT
jgi:hypothetical protein